MEKTVLVNSVASEAARLEAALKQGLEEKEVNFPVVSLKINGWGTLYELDLAHRLFDAYLLVLIALHNGGNDTQFPVGEPLVPALLPDRR